jgi:hypothetical protein
MVDVMRRGVGDAGCRVNRISGWVAQMFDLKSSRWVFGVIALLSWLAPLTSAFGQTQAALWRAQDIEFVYRSQASLFDCNVLRLKVLQVVAELGAHGGTRVEPISCHVARAAEVPSQLAALQIRIVSPALATTAAKDAALQGEGRRALLDRLGVESHPTGEFPAVWREVDVARASLTNFGREDCELLRQLRVQVLSKLAIRVLAHDRSCSAQRLRRPMLKVAVLLPAAVETVGLLGPKGRLGPQG